MKYQTCFFLDLYIISTSNEYHLLFKQKQKRRDGGDIGLFITLVPQGLYERFLNNFIKF